MEFVAEIIDPIHGFIQLNELELAIIDSQPFQRLRRIHQLALTYLIFPSADHKRFSHSLGVMHFASRIFDILEAKNRLKLKSQNPQEKQQGEILIDKIFAPKYKYLLRLAALLHDIGHPPFSHASETLFPFKDESLSQRFKHEDYTSHIIQNTDIKHIINSSILAQKFDFSAEDLITYFDKSHQTSKSFMKQILDGQVDADKMDYLLRDAYHCGVAYGQYDYERLIHCLQVYIDSRDHQIKIGIEKGGIAAVESLTMARWQMFRQVYFHHRTRVAEFHIQHLIKKVLPQELYPINTHDYLALDDYFIITRAKELFNHNNIHYNAIVNRTKPLKLIFEQDFFNLPETQKTDFMNLVEHLKEKIQKQDLGEEVFVDTEAFKLLTNPEDKTYNVIDQKTGIVTPIGLYSQLLDQKNNGILGTSQIRIFCSETAWSCVKQIDEMKRLISLQDVFQTIN